MPDCPHFTTAQMLGLETALQCAWEDLRLERAVGCSPKQAATYFVQHLDGSLPFLQRLGATAPAGEPEEPGPSPGLPPELAYRLNLTLSVAAHLQDKGYTPSDAIQTASLLVTAR